MNYETVIGLEVHVELLTDSKLFCSCPNSFGKIPNSLTCPICMGLPGALPSLNRRAVEYAIRTGLALGGTINPISIMDRKNYFYPDLPKSYQISQLYFPICLGGAVDIGEKSIRIHELHLEEDAGKLIHDNSAGRTFVDYNRCGVPLIEIVTEPDIRSGDEAVRFLDNLRRTLKFIGVSDCKIEEGSMRVDVNLSVRKLGSDKLGTRTEMKNLSSFKAVSKAVEYESARQQTLIENGEIVVMETRRWDENKCVTIGMRPKEEAYQYKYFPDPDIEPIVTDEAYLAAVRSDMCELPSVLKRKMIEEDGLPEYDSDILTSEPFLAELYKVTRDITGSAKDSSNWILTEFLKLWCNESDWISMRKESLGELIVLVNSGKISRQTGKEVLVRIYEDKVIPAEYVEENKLAMITDAEIIGKAVQNVIEQNPRSYAEYMEGNKKNFGFLMGQTVRALENRGDPSVIREVLSSYLDRGTFE